MNSLPPNTAGEGILAAIGSTPLVRLHSLEWPGGPRVQAKLEMLNPGGSAKDRPARRMIECALRSGRLRRGDLVVESSSGNMAVGMAQTCAALGLRFRCVTDRRIQPQVAAILRAYRATVEFVEVDDDRSRLEARLRRVREIVASTPGAWWPNQYANEENPRAHECGTMREIHESFGHTAPTAVFAAIATTGTVGGCLRYVERHRLPTRVIGVDARGSSLYGGASGPRPIAGLGAGVEPPLAARHHPHELIRVTAAECVVGCRRLVRTEGVLVGGSSGGVVEAFRRSAGGFGPGDTVVLVLADRGSRYLDTVYDDEWVRDVVGLSPTELEKRLENARAGAPAGARDRGSVA